jgi:hypothetical protein
VRLVVIWCAGCGRAWLEAVPGPSACSCECADPAAPGYERWLTEDLPAIPVVQAAHALAAALARGALSLS